MGMKNHNHKSPKKSNILKKGAFHYLSSHHSNQCISRHKTVKEKGKCGKEGDSNGKEAKGGNTVPPKRV